MLEVLLYGPLAARILEGSGSYREVDEGRGASFHCGAEEHDEGIQPGAS